jgi:hypothetical protein
MRNQMLQMMEQVVGPSPCSEVPTDYGDVTKVVWERPLARSSVAAVVAGWEIEMHSVMICSASVVAED